MKLSACMAFRKSEKGFTFLTMLVILAILAMSLPFLAYLTKSASYSTNYDEIAMRQFFQFLRDDAIHATSYHINDTTLVLEKDEDTSVTIEKYKDLIRRRVNKQGHEIYLREVKELSFTPDPNGTHVTVTSLKGERYEKTIIFYK